MYAEHVPAIAAGMISDPDIFARGCLFALASARQPIEYVPRALREIDEHGAFAPCLHNRIKLAGWQYLQDHGARLWQDVTALEGDTGAALERLTDCPALGIVKAAFVLQLIGHDIGCLDTHNLKREKIPMRAFNAHGRGNGRKAVYHKTQFARYLALAAGRAEELWNTWCTQVAEMRGYEAMEISALHLAIIN